MHAAQMALPNSPPWWQLFGVRYEDICGVCCEMQALYARPQGAVHQCPAGCTGQGMILTS